VKKSNIYCWNSGAAVAVLAFHGSVAAVRDMFWPKVMLGFFVAGVILIGFLHIAKIRRVNAVFKSWQSSVNDYFTDNRGWSDIVNDDVARAKTFAWSEYLAYASFACFVIGAAIGMFNFSTLTSGENHVGQEAHAAAEINPSTETIDSAAPTIERHYSGRRAEKIGDAKHASTSTNTKEKMTSDNAAPASSVTVR
jgi:hypothetical protein